MPQPPKVICGICQKENVTVHLTLIVHKKMLKRYFCQRCALEQKITDPNSIALKNVLLGLDSENGTSPPLP